MEISSYLSGDKLLEGTSAFLFCGSLMLVFTFLYILYDEWENRGQLFYTAAIAVVVYHVGEVIRQGWIWYWRHIVDKDISWLSPPMIAIYGLGSIIVSVGLILKIKAFSKARFGHLAWIVAAVLSLSLAWLATMLPR